MQLSDTVRTIRPDFQNGVHRVCVSHYPGLSASYLLGTCYVPDHVSAGRIIFNPQQKSQLQQVKTIFIKALTLTEKGLVDPTVIEKAASDRLAATGFTVITTRKRAA